ncbi:putative membrane protein [Ancylobacter sp. 3268]|uniref:DUF4126 family protein n=1 Tax=Ancylobacter sp. 3268 TaxID=2817752 RepID=UPI00286778A2|nr:DUF4126 family protein [Ancylobacter sp. 3268]MDR6951475.1 putative membrane protein [Ancylobacter sp. 3268]
MLYLLAVLIGVVAGLRAMTAPAAIAWAAHLGWIDLSASPLAFMGYAWTPWIFTALALVEFVTDQLPTTPSRTVPPQFGARLISGALCGACLGVAGGSLLIGAVAGAIGAAIGTLGGRSARGRLAELFGKDRPAALIEDAVSVIGALVIVMVP